MLSRKKILFFVAFIWVATPVFADNTSVGVEFFVRDETSGTPIDGDQTVTLGLCDAALGGTCYCSNTGTYTFDNGFLGTSLDCAADFGNIPTPAYLRMTVLGVTASSEIQAVPFAVSALKLADGDITINGNLNVTGAVTGGTFPGVSGGSGDITSVIAGTGLSGGGVTGDVTLTSTLGTSIDSSEIVDGTIVAADLANDSVTSAQIAADAVGSSEIATDAVGAAEIATGAVTTTEILNGTIGNADIANDAVTLGTQTTGNYVASIASAGAVSSSALGAEGSIYTIGITPDGIDFDSLSDAMTLDAASSVTLGANDLNFRLTGTGKVTFTNSTDSTFLSLDAFARTITILNTDTVSMPSNLNVGGYITRGCPTGFVNVFSVTNNINGSDFCIEANARVAATWHSASSTCFEARARLCRPSEYYVACINEATSGLNSIPNAASEWIDEVDYSAGPIYSGFTMGNVGTCTEHSPDVTTNTHPYRCCVNK